MLKSTTLGRLSAERMAAGVLHDAPNAEIAAILTKLDEVIDALKALDAANTSAPAVVALAKIELYE